MDPRIESSPVRPKLLITSFSCLQSALYTVWSLYLMFLQALLLYCFVLFHQMQKHNTDTMILDRHRFDPTRRFQSIPPGGKFSAFVPVAMTTIAQLAENMKSEIQTRRLSTSIHILPVL